MLVDENIYSVSVTGLMKNNCNTLPKPVHKFGNVYETYSEVIREMKNRSLEYILNLDPDDKETRDLIGELSPNWRRISVSFRPNEKEKSEFIVVSTEPAYFFVELKIRSLPLSTEVSKSIWGAYRKSMEPNLVLVVTEVSHKTRDAFAHNEFLSNVNRVEFADGERCDFPVRTSLMIVYNKKLPLLNEYMGACAVEGKQMPFKLTRGGTIFHTHHTSKDELVHAFAAKEPEYLRRYRHDELVGICLALFPVINEKYAMLWIFDWLEDLCCDSEITKISTIYAVYRSIENVLVNRRIVTKLPKNDI